MGFRKASSVPSEQVLTTHDFIYQDCAWVGIKKIWSIFQEGFGDNDGVSFSRN